MDLGRFPKTAGCNGGSGARAKQETRPLFGVKRSFGILGIASADSFQALSLKVRLPRDIMLNLCYQYIRGPQGQRNLCRFSISLRVVVFRPNMDAAFF